MQYLPYYVDMLHATVMPLIDSFKSGKMLLIASKKHLKDSVEIAGKSENKSMSYVQ